MKIIRSGLNNILVVAILVDLAVLLVACSSNANSDPTTSSSSPLPTPTTSSVQVSPLAAPNVPLARIGKPILSQIAGQAAAVPYGDQGSLVTIIRQGDSAKTVLLNPRSGETRLITDTALSNARVSSHWLVYEDRPPIGASADYYSRIKIIDLETGAEITLGDKNANQQSPDVSGDVVVWIDWRNQEKSGVDIYGYDLAKRQEFAVVVKPGPSSGPKISGEWVVYVEPTTQAKYLAELRAHSLVTGEDFSIGIIPAPQDATNGTYYAIDGDEVAWTKIESLSQFASALHLYNLNTRLDRQLTEKTTHEPSSGLSLSSRKGIVVCGCAGQGWAVFDIFQSPPVQLDVSKPMDSPSGDHLSISGDDLVWWVGLRAGTYEANVYTASINR